MACCSVWSVFDENNNLIREYKHWKLLVRNRNTTLGNCVVLVKRHIEKFSDITPEEMSELARVVKDVEKSLGKSFSYDKINWLMLMMKDSHVHFHVIPRYSSERNFAGIRWVDTFDPNPLNQKHPDLSKETLDKVKEEIIKNL